MDAPRRTIAIGPLEITIKRRDDGVRLGVAASLIAHILIVALFMIAPPSHRASTTEALPAAPVPVPVTFVEPKLPPPRKPRVDEIDSRRPPPAPSTKPLRMEPVPESSASTSRNKDRVAQSAGHQDRNPPGGEAGGPKPSPEPGVPPAATAGVAATQSPDNTMPDNAPKDILGRLREFKKAVEAPRPTESGPEGGGHGHGGAGMPNLPATGFGVGNLEFEGRDYDWENYGRQIHGIIWRAWHNRLLVTASVFERWAAENRTWMLDHQNGVRFTILRSGQVVDVAIETPSGCYPLDDSAVDALKEVVLPPLPSDFSRDREVVHARFIAEGEIRQMKPFLQQLKNAGYF